MARILTGRARRTAYRSWLILAAAVCVMTTTVFESFHASMRWRPTGANRLVDPSIPTGAKEWRTTKDAIQRRQDFVRLEVSDDKPLALALQRVPIEGPARYLISGEIRTRGLGADGQKKPSARVVLVSLDPDRRALFHRPHVACEVVEDREWHPFRGSVLVWDDVRELDAGVQVHGHRGTCDVRNLDLRLAEENTLFAWFRDLLVVTWVALLARGAWLLFRRRRFSFARLAMGITIAGILIGTSTPVQWTEPFHYAVKSMFRTEAPVLETRTAAPDPAPTIERRTDSRKSSQGPQRTVRKVGHFVCFGILAWTAWMTRRRRTIRPVLALCFVVACLTECLQYLADGRGPGLLDIGIDMAGAGVALGIILAWQTCSATRTRSGIPSRGPNQVTM